MSQTKLPKFPVRFSFQDRPHQALFKPTGRPGEIKVVVQDRSKRKTVASQILPLSAFSPDTAWPLVAKEAIRQTNRSFKEATNAMHSSKKDRKNSKPSGPSGTLSGMRDDSNKIVQARDARPDQQYVTWKNPTDRSKHVLCKLDRTLPNGKVVLWCFLRSYKEWRPVEVEATYPLMPTQFTSKEDQQMPKKKLPKKLAPPPAKKSKGLTVYQAWGQAFKRFGTKPDAPKLIVEFMKKQFPEKETNWAKWVNSVRALYNRADKRLEQPAPKTPISVYKTEAPSKKKSKKKPAPTPKKVKAKVKPAPAPEEADDPIPSAEDDEDEKILNQNALADEPVEEPEEDDEEEKF